MAVDERANTATPVIAALRARVAGRVVGPGERDWENERRAWNLAVEQRPAAVVHVDSVADVVAAVRVASEHGVPVGAQPVGHGAASPVDGTVLLRTGALTEIDVDVAAGTARVGAGVRWRDLNAALSPTGLSGLPGSSGDPSVVGYVLGGGLSWFGRKYGMAASHVLGFELVSPDGTEVTVTRESDPELFWALCGGGGEFGIVTSVEIELVFVGQIYGGRLAWSIEHASEVLRAFAAVTAHAPDELSLWAWLFNLPDMPDLPGPLRGRWAVAVDVTFLGPRASAERYLAELRDVATPTIDTLGFVPLTELDGIAAEPEDPAPLLASAALLTRFDDTTIDVLLDAATPGERSPVAVFEVRHLGGGFARPGDEVGAACRIAEPYLFLLGGYVPSPDAEIALTATIDGVRGALAPYMSEFVPPNFSEERDATSAYRPDVLARLREIKQARDPNDVIRGNRPF